MTLTFQLRFHTRPGQSLWLRGGHPLLGGGDPLRAVPLQYRDRESWHVTLAFPPATAMETPFTYHYELREGDGTATQDRDVGRVIHLAGFQADAVHIVDSWNAPGFIENVFYTEPFQNVLLAQHQSGVSVPAAVDATHRFTVKAPLLARGQTLCLLGHQPALGGWNPARPVLLNRVPGEAVLWVDLNLAGAAFPLEYKFGVYDFDRQSFLHWEDGSNRVLREPPAPGRFVVINDGFARLPNDTWRGAGVAIPVFSLRSRKSFGVGEFSDLKALADWCARVGLKLIQILPVNDTTATHTWTDSYPYSAISAFALHPQYLNLARVATGRNRFLLKKLEKERCRLNALPEVDYEAVTRAKLGFLRRIFPSQKAATFRRQSFRQFFTENQHWLVPYAAFCHLRDAFGTADFSRWPEFSRFDAGEIKALSARDARAAKAMEFHYFVQYHLDAQLKEASGYAHARGVILKGDIAIGVSRQGADAWQQPELFHLDQQAGAPPDAFAVKGQNWGFPTYDWSRMQETGFAWWKQRFEQMGRCFDAFRVDHILGFFRIWSIPLHAVEGLLGRFVRALPLGRDEFSARGIPFDHDRYVKPFITDDILQAAFGPEANPVKRRFLVSDGNGRYSLKPQFVTQRQVERHFASLVANDRNRKLRQGLFDLISNVILLEDEAAPGKYHFRFDLATTASFRALDARTQSELQELYVDYFYRRQDEFWMKEAMRKLPALKRVTNMLVCGEDLGVVPACVPDTMKQLGLLSLEVQRMPKRPGQEFFRPASAPYLSVVTPSTHDMSTLRGWWREDRAVTQKFWAGELNRPGAAPVECDADINREIVRQHLACPAMWSIFQLQDLLGMDAGLRRANVDDERVNIPAIPNYYWRYRMHLDLEELLAADDFNDALAALVRGNGR